MAETETMEFLLDKGYIEETFDTLLAEPGDGKRGLTPSEIQRIALVLSATLKEAHKKFRYGTVSQRGERFLILLSTKPFRD